MDQEVRILDLIQHRHFTGGGTKAREATSSLAPALGLQALRSGGKCLAEIEMALCSVCTIKINNWATDICSHPNHDTPVTT